MYVSPNFPTKKALKAAVKAYNDYEQLSANAAPLSIAAVHLHKISRPAPVTVFSPGPFPAPTNGETTIEGPHYPKPHTWYARVQVTNGKVTKVIG